MNCTECQLQIFDGELSPAATVHLTECEDCRALDREVRLNTAALAEFRDEPLPAERRPRRWQPWVAAMGAAAAALLVVLWGPHQFPHPPVAQPPDIVRSVDPPLVVAEVLPPAPPVKRQQRVRRPPPAVAQPLPLPERPPEQPLLVKFFTDDPDVVVYWIVDPNQGEPGL